MAPVLLGGSRLALTDVGVPTIADARRLSVSGVERLGDDLLVIATPVGEGADSDTHELTQARRGA